MESKKIGVIGNRDTTILGNEKTIEMYKAVLQETAERGIKITNEPQPIPFKLNNYSTEIPTVTGAVFTKPHKPNTGFKLGSYTYKSKRK